MTQTDLGRDHTPAAIRHRFANVPERSHLRDWVYGGIDGSVTTFSIVAGVVGAAAAMVAYVVGDQLKAIM